jgi:esterase/lipase
MPRAEMIGLLLWPYGEMIGKAVEGDYVEWEPSNEGHGTYWTNRYPVGAVVEMMRLLKHVNGHDFSQMDVPVQVIYSPNDQVVDPEYIVNTYETMGSPRKAIIPLEDVESENNHVLAGDILSPGDTERVINYIDSFVRGE